MLRWFDHWLKGKETGLDDEKPVKLFIVGTERVEGGRRLAGARHRWTPFYLHRGGLLSEHEFWPSEGGTTWEDSPFFHGEAVWTTPAMVENMEICGPMALNIWASTTDTEALFFASLILVDGRRHARVADARLAARLPATARPKASKPWWPVQSARQARAAEAERDHRIQHRHQRLWRAPQGRRAAGLRLKSADDEKPMSTSEVSSMGHLWRRSASHVTVHHDADHPSHLLLPVTKGNVVGTFISGGKLPGEG